MDISIHFRKSRSFFTFVVDVHDLILEIMKLRGSFYAPDKYYLYINILHVYNNKCLGAIPLTSSPEGLM